MAEDEFFKVQNQTECLHDRPTVYNFPKLTDEMVKTIIEYSGSVVKTKI